MATTLIENGRVICPAQAIDKTLNVVLADGRIRELTEARPDADESIDAAGLIVAPGLIDMHVHLREPGKESAETIASGSAAAVAGGFTTIACMPNTEPAVDNEASSEFVFLQAERAGLANIYPVGAVTKGRQGEELAEIGQLSRGGAVAFSDDGSPIRNADIMRRGLEYARMFDRAIIEHCEDLDLSGEGVMNEGVMSTVLGLPGIPAASEEVAIARNIILARLTGARLHVAHVSTAGGVELVRRGKQAGAAVTAEVTPHHFTLTDECVRTYDPVYKMNPPLRTRADVDALREGLRDGTIDVIASDHAPHPTESKQIEFSRAPFGVIGMESLLPVSIAELIDGVLDWPGLVAKLTVNPAAVLGIEGGTLRAGAEADVTLIDPDVSWTLDARRFRSRSRNCPFDGREVRGRAVRTIVGGVTRFVAD
ncbi:MAG: dihydroorotase [Planctomycetota bacterium]